MALADVKEYYMKMLTQYVEVKNDLADFEIALKDGNITEDQLVSAKEDVNNIKNNVDRLAYILYLFDLPKRKNKKVIFKNKNEDIIKYFSSIKADTDAVFDENISLTQELKKELNKLKNE